MHSHKGFLTSDEGDSNLLNDGKGVVGREGEEGGDSLDSGASAVGLVAGSLCNGHQLLKDTRIILGHDGSLNFFSKKLRRLRDLHDKVVEGSTAAVTSSRRGVEPHDKGCDKVAEMNTRVNDLEHSLSDLAQCPCNSVSDLQARIGLHHADKGAKSLGNEGSESHRVRTVKDGTKRHDGGLSVLPVLSGDTSLNEGNNGANDLITDILSQELQAGSSGHRFCPVIFVIILILLGKEFEEYGKDVIESSLGKALGLNFRVVAILQRLWGISTKEKWYQK